MIQSYDPEHYSIQTAARQDFKAFYEEEIAYRDLLRYPPISHMMCVQIQSKDEDAGMKYASRFRAMMEGQKVEGAIFIGPALAPIARINDVYRMAIYVKHDDYDKLVMLKDALEGYVKELEQMGELRGVVTQFDFDPMHG